MNRYWPNNTIYFLTGSTFLHFPYFNGIQEKQILLNQIKQVRESYEITEVIYSISINHYHLKFYLEKGLDLAKIKQIMHGGTTYKYRKSFTMKYKDMWQSSRTFQVVSEEMNWKVIGYIIGNLLKHKEVSTFQELKENPFSSYHEIVKRYGEQFAKELVHSVIDVDEDAEGIVNIQILERLKSISPSACA